MVVYFAMHDIIVYGGKMDKRIFLQSVAQFVGLVTLGSLPGVSAFAHALSADDKPLKKTKMTQFMVQFMDLSCVLIARDNLSAQVGKDILGKISEAKQLAMLDRLTVQYCYFNRFQTNEDKPEHTFFDYLEIQNETELLQLGKDIVYAWYTGIARFEATKVERLSYETSLQYSVNQNVYTPSSYCGGEFGYWRKPATEQLVLQAAIVGT